MLMDDATFDRHVQFVKNTYFDGGTELFEDQVKQFADLFYFRVLQDEEAHRTEAEDNLRRLIRLSQEHKYIWDTVNLIARRLLEAGTRLPTPLAQWVADVLVNQTPERGEGRRPRPRRGGRKALRDRMICLAIKKLVDQGVTATRSGGRAKACREGGSACDVGWSGAIQERAIHGLQER